MVYARVAVIAGPSLSVLSGWTAFLVCVGAGSALHPSPGLSLVLAASCFGLALKLIPERPSAPKVGAARPWWDLPARALAAALLVLTLTGLSGTLGAHLSGLLAPFPIITSVLAVFTHAHEGASRAGLLLRSFLVGFYGFAAFCFTLAVGLPVLGVGGAFGVAMAVAIAVQAITLVVRSRLLVAPATG